MHLRKIARHPHYLFITHPLSQCRFHSISKVDALSDTIANVALLILVINSFPNAKFKTKKPYC